ncbi:MAG: helix-turn-helix domain-containing protein [Acidipropionibacterium sp.]|jgi:DNA-directed RNA polymerase specialized sigma24 family protein|nr:helix-turn-helix domain-containing protein [Acidipropionibacterium sp.]
MTIHLTAHVIRSGGWWAVSVDEVEGLNTQARRLDQVPAMVLDAAALLTDRPESDFDVEVSTDGLYADQVAEYKSAAQQAAEASAHAAAVSRQSVARLRADGLPVRDVATILGVSPQRVSQLSH